MEKIDADYNDETEKPRSSSFKEPPNALSRKLAFVHAVNMKSQACFSKFADFL